MKKFISNFLKKTSFRRTLNFQSNTWILDIKFDSKTLFRLKYKLFKLSFSDLFKLCKSFKYFLHKTFYDLEKKYYTKRTRFV